ncbi:MAG: acyl-ACP desaturase [Elusimicrobia bacterium]|nr:acyl-ACP desaturase [Elusimicrobiota bacterium]
MSNPYLREQVPALVRRYLERFETLGWNRFKDFDFASAQGGLLTDEQFDALKTSMLVEDHIPGYANAYLGLFRLDPDLPADELFVRRHMLHFVFKWCSDEDRHAQTLETYIRATGRITPEALEAEMLKAGANEYKAPHLDPMQMAVYTVIQEKATQVFYSCLREAVADPVLKQVLDALSKDEARHCGFFSDLLRMYLAAPGGVDYSRIKEAVVDFKMPLYGVLDNYKRRSIVMMRAAKGYHFRDAFSQIARAVGKYADAPEGSRSVTLEDLLGALEVRTRPAVRV